MKEQETLEEAAKNYGWRIKRNPFSDAVKANELAESAQQDFIAGAKWQAERMYSEEDMRLAFKAGFSNGFASDILSTEKLQKEKEMIFGEWFEQFKKK